MIINNNDQMIKPISEGGTGATTKEQALSNLGFYPSIDEYIDVSSQMQYGGSGYTPEVSGFMVITGTCVNNSVAYFYRALSGGDAHVGTLYGSAGGRYQTMFPVIKGVKYYCGYTQSGVTQMEANMYPLNLHA